MKRIFIIIFILSGLLGCKTITVGTEGRKCLDNDTCIGDNLVCTQQGICKPCGGETDLCCQNKVCNDDLVCGEEGLCQECGRFNHPCCSGKSCKGDDVKCNRENICVPCGFKNGGPCCNNATCYMGMGCNSQGICTADCGDENEICCANGLCKKGVCTSKNICKSEYFNAEGSSVACGSNDESCCEGQGCEVGLECNSDNICIFCGFEGLPICTKRGYECSGWLMNNNGNCTNPFISNPNTNVRICARVEPGHISEDYQDWCYWNAAYYKKDGSICGLIQWEEMRTICKEMENPGKYNIQHFGN